MVILHRISAHAVHKAGPFGGFKRLIDDTMACVRQRVAPGVEVQMLMEGNGAGLIFAVPEGTPVDQEKTDG